jgi:uncharacterized protein (TIGR00269 family)
MAHSSCDKCGRPPVLFQRYSGRHLCDEHFVRDLETRVKRTIREKGWLRPGDRIGVALSGGKDSSALLSFLSGLVARRRDIDLLAITVDEGISGYRDPARSVRIAESFGCRCITVSFREAFGTTIDEYVSRCGDTTSCSACGVKRRQLLNAVALEHGVTRLALGFNLDDEAQTVLMNVLRGDADRLLRPYSRDPLVVPRIRPLMSIPEREVALYALLKGIGFKAGRCPYAYNALRVDVRSLLNRYAWNHPAARFSLVRLGDTLASARSCSADEGGNPPEPGGHYEET